MIEADAIDFAAYMDITESEQKVRPATTWRQMFRDRLSGRVKPPQGAQLPWAKARDLLAFAPGGVSLWVGINGHGKSLMLGQCCISWCAQGEKVCIASFEMRPDKTLERMAHQFLDTRHPSEAEGDEFMDWSDGKLWLYDQQGSVDSRMLLAVIRYSAEKLGITQFVIDNLIKCVRSDEDYEGQKAFVDALTVAARDYNLHIHLVHHARKGPDEHSAPRKMDSLGAGSVVNLVDNLLIVWRNKAKEDAKYQAKKAKPRKDGEKEPTPAETDEKMPDALLLCDKNRHGDWEGRIGLWFHHRSTQYIAHPRDPAMDLRTYPHDQP